MCGIYGLFYKSSGGCMPGDIDMLKNMAIVTSLRGDHSSGISVLRNDPSKRPWVVKSIGDPFNLFHNKDVVVEMKKFFEGTKASLGAFGHGRLATRGDITSRNAHPFVEGHITLVHNGTINSGVDMTKECEQGKKVDVDSHALAISMSKVGVKEALSRVYGAFAIIAHDQQEKCVWIARNTERPLHYIIGANRLFIMSEEKALEYVVMRDARLTSYSQKGMDVEQFKANKLYKFDLNTFVLSEEGDILEERTRSQRAAPFKSGKTPTTAKEHLMVLKEVRGPTKKEYLYVFEDEDENLVYSKSSKKLDVSIGQLASTTHIYHEWAEGMKVSTKNARMKSIEWYDTSEVLTGEEIITTRNNKSISRKAFLTLAAEGCACCDGPVWDNEGAKSILTDANNLVCGQCVDAGLYPTADMKKETLQ